MLTINDMLVDCPIENAASKIELIESEQFFGRYTCIDGWFFKQNFFGSYSGFKATDICWVYPRKVGHVVGIIPIVVPLPATFDVVCKLSNGTEIILSDTNCMKSGEKIPANTVEIFQQLQLLIPWAIFGYSPYFKECWEKHGRLFLEIHNERLARIREGLKEGNIIVQPNGSLAVLSTFTLPTIAVKFEKNPKGKLERVYYQTES